MTKKCHKCIEFLADFLEDDLPADQQAEFEEHLNRCPPCREYVDSYRETIKLARQCLCEHAEAGASEDESEKDCPSPPHMPEALVQAILKTCCKNKSGGDSGGCGCS